MLSCKLPWQALHEKTKKKKHKVQWKNHEWVARKLPWQEGYELFEKTCTIAVSKPKPSNTHDQNPTQLLFRPIVKHQNKCKLWTCTLQAEGSSQQRCCATIIAIVSLSIPIQELSVKGEVFKLRFISILLFFFSLFAIRKQSSQPVLLSLFQGLQAGSVSIWINTPKATIGEATKVVIHA